MTAKPRAKARSRLAGLDRDARRAALLGELVRCRWNLTHVAEQLQMYSPSNVLRAVRRLGLTREYAAAKACGLIFRGRRCHRVALAAT